VFTGASFGVTTRALVVELAMLSEEFVSSVCGQPLSANTAVAKDVGVYCHSVRPTYSVNATFKKSSVPVNCLAVNDTHIFAAQHEKAYVHVYSRLRGNQEAFVSLPERIRSIALVGDVLVMGTAEGRLMLWEVSTQLNTRSSDAHG
jgi:pre-rRNA-processing protein IPI3